MEFNLRPVEECDLKLTLEWRNDPNVLKQAQTPDPISYFEHFASYKYNNSIKLIFEVDKTPVGYVTITRDPDAPAGEWSFHMGKTHRGTGLSEIMLKSALYYFKNKEGYVKVVSKVKKDNSISKHLHYKLGFTYTQDKDNFHEYYLNL